MTSLAVAAKIWPTPNAGGFNDAEPPEQWRARQETLQEKGINGNGAGVPLAIMAQESAALWATPRSSDGEKGGPHQQFGAGGTPLPAQAVTLWAGPASRQAPTTETAGEPSSKATPTSRLQLNPRFVELLMGLPCGWTDCEPSATPSSRSRRRPPSASSGTAPSASGPEDGADAVTACS